MLGMSESDFKSELTKYSLTELTTIKNCFEGCVSVLSGLGAEAAGHAAHTQYVNMTNKVAWTEAEASVRENECNIISAMCGTNAKKNTEANPFGLMNIKIDIQKYLDLENYLGAVLWTELNAFRREEAYSDSNYISDGLENGELIRRSYELLRSAEQKMAENNKYSYEISATLKNLLLIPEFAPLKDYLACGNWLRIKTDDGKLFKLRLTSYEFDFDNPATLSVTFSDITDTSNIRSMQSLVKKMDYITRNAMQTNVNTKFEYLSESVIETSNYSKASTEATSGEINEISDTFNIQINNKIDKGDGRSIVTAINADSSGVSISGEKISLYGYTTINDYFKVDLNGKLHCKNAYIEDVQIDRGLIACQGGELEIGNQAIEIDERDSERGQLKLFCGGVYVNPQGYLHIDGHSSSGYYAFSNVAINGSQIHIGYQNTDRVQIWNCSEIYYGAGGSSTTSYPFIRMNSSQIGLHGELKLHLAQGTKTAEWKSISQAISYDDYVLVGT